MIEPTESENKQRLDEFVNSMIKIANECISNPQNVLDAPHNTPVKKIDEVTAARHPDLNFKKQND
jgi:glycine dehydrogenase subunit 2